MKLPKLQKPDSYVGLYVVDDLSTGTLKNILPMLQNPAFQFHKADILCLSRAFDVPLFKTAPLIFFSTDRQACIQPA